ncbi:MAG TPA: TIGR03618 family F420-dependent PPOX class oxidoreductase [Pseudonocardiaceae bacterium]|nr:TIGR03618 family F420-dependent PPOX class oxidoreductase [Pseudonocardiaceae bacterium]
MLSLTDVAELAREDGLAVVSTLRADHTVQTTVVNVGVLKHPVTGDDAVGLVTYGRAKLANLRRWPHTTITVRSGSHWIGVEGRAWVVGPDDPQDGFDADRLRLLLRDVFIAAGGTHDNWTEYDLAMEQQRRAAVLITPTRIYSNTFPG